MMGRVPGASLAFTSVSPRIVRARLLMDAGDFAGAVRAAEEAAEEDPAAAGEFLEVMARVRMAYDLDAAGLLAKLAVSIPDVTAADLERWRAAGEVQHRVIDGRVWYFGREPSNIFRFCAEARERRRVAAPVPPSAWRLEDHLARVMAEAGRAGAAQVVPVRHRVRYRLTIPPAAPHVKAGVRVRAWLPFPRVHERQRDVRLVESSPAGAVVAPESAAQRTLYFEHVVVDPTLPIEFEEAFSFTSFAYCPAVADRDVCALPAGWRGEGLGERPPHIVFSAALREATDRAVGDDPNPLSRARKVYRFVTRHVAYCAEEEYGIIPSLSDKALRSGRGDCGVQAMLFIAMCRAAGVPARWQSGWETKRVNMNMHDWAEFYVTLRDGDVRRRLGCDSQGGIWLPCDPSYGAEFADHPDARVREFYFGNTDSYRLIVNSDYGQLLAPPKDGLRSEPLDFQRGEVEVDGRNLYFPYWTYDMGVEWLDEGP